MLIFAHLPRYRPNRIRKCDGHDNIWSNIIRSYIQTVEANAMKKGNIAKEFTKWLTWADQKVSWYDPMFNDPDPLLNDHHKTLLFKEFLREWQ